MQVYILQFRLYILLFFSLNFKIKLCFFNFVLETACTCLQWKTEGSSVSAAEVDWSDSEKLQKDSSEHVQITDRLLCDDLRSFIPHCMETALFMEMLIKPDFCAELFCVCLCSTLSLHESVSSVTAALHHSNTSLCVCDLDVIVPSARLHSAVNSSHDF